MKTFFIIIGSMFVGIAIGSGFTEASIEREIKKLACDNTYESNSDKLDCLEVITKDNVMVFERDGLKILMGH
jgi:hypothetical protein